MRRSSLLPTLSVAVLLAGCSACSSVPEAEVPAAAQERPVQRREVGREPPEGELVRAELSTVGWDAYSGTPVVLLRELDSGQVLPIWIGLAEARAIAQALHGIEPPRPQTHDLTASLLGHLGATLEEVVVTRLFEGTYYGLLKVRDESGEARWVDTRPSDGLALALRTGARIRVAAKILEEQTDFQFQAPESSQQVVRVLGLTVRAPTPELREQFGLPERDGLVVVAVAGEAERRGLERGDLIVDVDGKVPEEPLDLLEAIRGSAEGILGLTYWRDGKEKSVELEIRYEDPELEREEGQIAFLRLEGFQFRHGGEAVPEPQDRLT